MIKRKRPTFKMHVTGGLGNQLFCYFAGYYFANKFESKLVVDMLYASKAHSKKYSLLSFNLDGKFTNQSGSYISKVKKLGWRGYDSICFRIPIAKVVLGSIFHIYTEIPRTQYNPNLISKLRPNHRIKGFFTTCKYLVELQNEGQFKTLNLINPSKWFLELQHRAYDEKPIAIHIRRGDFIAGKDTYGVLSQEFYSKVIELMKEKFPSKPIWIFSNDQEEIQTWKIFHDENISFIRQEMLLENEFEFDPAEEMMLMAAADVIVVANSSFSLFAGLLSLEAREIFRPEPMSKTEEYSNKNFYPDKWTKIESKWE